MCLCLWCSFFHSVTCITPCLIIRKSNTGIRQKKIKNNKSARSTLFENFMLLQYNNYFVLPKRSKPSMVEDKHSGVITVFSYWWCICVSLYCIALHTEIFKILLDLITHMMNSGLFCWRNNFDASPLGMYFSLPIYYKIKGAHSNFFTSLFKLSGNLVSEALIFKISLVMMHYLNKNLYSEKSDHTPLI